MKNRFLLVLFLCSIFSVSAIGQTVDLPVLQDTYINLGAPDTSYGSDGTFTVSRDTSGQLNRQGFMQFDISKIYGIDPSRILSATLKLNYYGSASAGQLEMVTQPWYADELTWNNPAATTSSLSAGWNAPATVNHPNVSDFTVDITSMVQSWAAGTNPNFGVKMRTYGGGGYVATWFFSKESGAMSPVIEVEVDGSLDGIRVIPLVCTKDAYVDPSQPDTNYGNLNQLQISRNDAPLRNAFMQFDLTNLIGTDPEAIDDVTLKMNRALYSGDGNFGPVGVVNSSWQEETITYNNAPSVDYNTGFDWFSNGGEGYNTFIDVNEIVINWMSDVYENNGINLRLYSGGYSLIIFDSKEETAVRNLPPVIEVVVDPYGSYDIPWFEGSVDRQDKALYTDGVGNKWGFYEVAGRSSEFMRWSAYEPMEAQLVGNDRFWKGVWAQAKEAAEEVRPGRISGYYEPHVSGTYSDHYNGAVVFEPSVGGLVSWYGEIYCRVWSYDGPLHLEFVKFDQRNFPIHIHTETIELSSPVSPVTTDISLIPELQNISVKKGEKIAMNVRTELFGAHVVAEFATPVGIDLTQGTCIEQGGIEGDLNQNCEIDENDFYMFVEKWLECSDPFNSSCL